jgi:hypothetical protein
MIQRHHAEQFVRSRIYRILMNEWTVPVLGTLTAVICVIVSLNTP